MAEAAALTPLRTAASLAGAGARSRPIDGVSGASVGSGETLTVSADLAEQDHGLGHPGPQRAAEDFRLSQFQAWDMLVGELWPGLGGAPQSAGRCLCRQSIAKRR